MKSILGKCKIIYANGGIQYKILIDHKVYDEHKKKLSDTLLAGGGDKAIQKINKEFKKLYGDEFFTTESPLGLAMRIGYLVLPETQGGNQKCEINFVD